MNLPLLQWGVAWLTAFTGILALRSVTKPSPTMTPIMLENDVQDIVSRYENDQLAQLDDAALVKAADKLEYAYKHYFDGMVLSEMPMMLFHQAQMKQRELRQIADSIWRLLSTRYGCND